ncbi:uncharacterized protein [Dermacentor albipictus]|uniref:uncharacterized protein n=1 Tax=Dermacentor albipictus TaxID=60249 RepID=UPI0038FCE825
MRQDPPGHEAGARSSGPTSEGELLQQAVLDEARTVQVAQSQATIQRELLAESRKFCDLRNILNGIPYGIAVFDVDEDAWEENPCVYGPKNFERLNMVRKLVDHVSRPGNDHFPVGCWMIT